MPDWLSALLASPLVIAAIAGLITITSKALDRRSAAKLAREKAAVLRINAETERMLAEARVRESQARITESDGTTIRETLEAVMLEREQDRKEARETRDALNDLRVEFRKLEGALSISEMARIIELEAREKAERENDAMRRSFAEIWRTRRLPKDTPQPFAAVDHTVPFHTQGKAT